VVCDGLRSIPKARGFADYSLIVSGPLQQPHSSVVRKIVKNGQEQDVRTHLCEHGDVLSQAGLAVCACVCVFKYIVIA